MPAIRRLIGLTITLAGVVATAWAQAMDPPREPNDPSRSRREREFGEERVPIYFPPNPPPLDFPFLRTVSPAGRLPAPQELAPYTHEYFYPALGTRLATRRLYPPLPARLDKYRLEKLALQKELRAVIDQHAGAEPEVRRQALENFARTQTPKIMALEKTAEDLRRELVTWNSSWTAHRQWHLGDKERRGFSPGEIAFVMRGYAYYHHGLSPVQRGLLREVATELMSAVENVAAASNQPYLFFSPEMARVKLPEDLPAELAAKVAAFQTKKSRLKKELYDNVQAYDGAVLGFLRNSFKTLTEKQAGSLKEMDALAEEIRRGLAALPPNAELAPKSPLPPTLALRAASVIRERAVARRDAGVKAEAILEQGRGVEAQNRIVYRFAEDGMIVTRLPQRGPPRDFSPEAEEVLTRIQGRLNDVAAEYGRRLAALLNELESVRLESAAALGGENRREQVEAALLTASQIAIRDENAAAYRDYRTAAFEPGLSPEQRRLLFNRAVEQLELPLPRGELQISVRAKTW